MVDLLKILNIYLCTIYSRHHIESDATLAIMSSWGRTLGGHKITAGHLQNPTLLEQLVRKEQVYKFLKNVQGLPAYWQDQLYDVLEML